MPAGSPGAQRRERQARSGPGPSACLTVGPLVAELFSRFMSGTGLDFSIPARSMASPHDRPGVSRLPPGGA